MSRLAPLTLGLLIGTLPFAANAACRQALALGLDVSSSVDPREYDLQMGGLANALMDPDVQTVLLAQPDAPVTLAIYEWSSKFDQNLIVDWTRIKGAEDLKKIAAVLHARHHNPKTRSTAIGHAIRYGGRLLARAPKCWNMTLDISGDGKNNDGFRPSRAHEDAIFATATINGLVIGADVTSNDQIVDNEIGELSSYYRSEVIFGANSFIQTAVGFRDFQAAMRMKLLRELNIAVSEASKTRYDPRQL